MSHIIIHLVAFNAIKVIKLSHNFGISLPNVVFSRRIRNDPSNSISCPYIFTQYQEHCEYVDKPCFSGLLFTTNWSPRRFPIINQANIGKQVLDILIVGNMCVHLNGAVNVQSLSWMAEVDLQFNGML